MLPPPTRWTSLGKCGRCNVGKDYVCVKGPVYSWAELKDLPAEY
ncbi:MAG: hypothetical protein Q8O25_08185 [Sulfurisoma sp.]|nr:hypothetical protein [Sulfurisoma sp.]